MTTTQAQRDFEIGKCAYESIAEMVAALDVDYDRLNELAMIPASESTADECAEYDELRAAAGDCASRDDAETRIQEDPLSVEVRSVWVGVGEEMEAEEFCILLGTGGPATRIIGELEYGEPIRAWLEVQDWFTPWTQYDDADQAVLLTYCQQFYFDFGS